jgi:hypothetical protein
LNVCLTRSKYELVISVPNCWVNKKTAQNYPF